MRGTTILAAILVLATTPAPGRAQDACVQLPVDSIERLLARSPFQVLDVRASRGFEDERTNRVALSYPDGTLLLTKWAPAPPGGEAFNNVPRYELGAYELQKLFLTEGEYVVPPAVIRPVSIDRHRELVPRVRPTFRHTESVLVALSYWLFNVSPDEFWDRDRFEADSVYARHFANFNILTYLIRHSDANLGNYLICTDPKTPRVFSVDNGIAFSSLESDRGFHWRRLQVDRVPAATIQRLREVTEEELIRRLETVAELRILPDGRLESVPPTEAMSRNRGVRREGDRIQLGLTRNEIQDVWTRVRRLLRDVDGGRLEVF
ncbi:MAG: hypothetical protein ACOC3J_05485 [Gemmatimonadota bacterium]